MNAKQDFDQWLDTMKRIGVSEETHYHPLLQIAVKMRAEIEATERKLAEAEKALNHGLMDYKGEKPYAVKICNTFQPDSAGDEDVTLCVDITEALSDYEASKGVGDE